MKIELQRASEPNKHQVKPKQVVCKELEKKLNQKLLDKIVPAQFLHCIGTEYLDVKPSLRAAHHRSMLLGLPFVILMQGKGRTFAALQKEIFQEKMFGEKGTSKHHLSE